jgi:hypothetical protein
LMYAASLALLLVYRVIKRAHKPSAAPRRATAPVAG